MIHIDNPHQIRIFSRKGNSKIELELEMNPKTDLDSGQSNLCGLGPSNKVAWSDKSFCRSFGYMIMLQSSSDDLIIFISSQRKMQLFLTLTFNQKSNHHSFFHYCDINNKIKHVPREEIILILTTKNDLRRTTSSIFLATQGTMS